MQRTCVDVSVIIRESAMSVLLSVGKWTLVDMTILALQCTLDALIVLDSIVKEGRKW